MMTKIKNLLLACLEKNKDGVNYIEAFKLDIDHYKKVREARIERGLEVSPIFEKNTSVKDVKVGDFVYVHQKFPSFSGKKRFGYVERSEKGELYVNGYNLKGNDYVNFFYKERIYLHIRIVELVIIMRK